MSWRGVKIKRWINESVLSEVVRLKGILALGVTSALSTADSNWNGNLLHLWRLDVEVLELILARFIKKKALLHYIQSYFYHLPNAHVTTGWTRLKQLNSLWMTGGSQWLRWSCFEPFCFGWGRSLGGCAAATVVLGSQFALLRKTRVVPESSVVSLWPFEREPWI